jgi:polyhydroxybutyrate depolymerase
MGALPTVPSGSSPQRRGPVRRRARANNTVWLPVTAAAGVLLLLLWFAMSQGPTTPTAGANRPVGTGLAAAAGGKARGAAAPRDGAIPSPTPAVSGCVTGRSLPAGVSTQTISAGGVQRSFLLSVPAKQWAAQARPKRVPLIVSFHGFSQTPTDMESYTHLARDGAKLGYAVATPVGVNGRWNFVRRPAVGPDDVEFVRSLLADLTGRMCLDETRIFAAGVSDGADMAVTAACALPDRLAAVVAVGGSALPPSCPKPSASLLEIHGLEDTIAPYAGGGHPRAAPFTGITAQPAEDRLARYAAALGCAPGRVTSHDIARVRRVGWMTCPAGKDVQLFGIEGGGHTWPGAAPRPALGPTVTDLSASSLALIYFGEGPGLGHPATRPTAVAPAPARPTAASGATSATAH